MRAAVITEPGGPDVLKIMEVDDPTPGPEDILIDVKATALNRADTLQRQGGYPALHGSPSDIPGLEFAGSVICGPLWSLISRQQHPAATLSS